MPLGVQNAALRQGFDILLVEADCLHVSAQRIRNATDRGKFQSGDSDLAVIIFEEAPAGEWYGRPRRCPNCEYCQLGTTPLQRILCRTRIKAGKAICH